MRKAIVLIAIILTALCSCRFSATQVLDEIEKAYLAANGTVSGTPSDDAGGTSPGPHMIEYRYDLPASLIADSRSTISTLPEGGISDVIPSLPDMSFEWIDGSHSVAFSFLGWYYHDGAEAEAGDEIAEDTILYARWNPYATDSSGGYYVYSEDGLNAWAESVSSDSYLNCTLIADISFDESIWEAPAVWGTSPAGVQLTPGAVYSGVFDGNGYTISDLLVEGHGFINRIGGTVKNLTIENIEVFAAQNAGAITGSLYGGSIINCHVIGGLVSNDYIQAAYTGGLAGYISGGRIEGSSFEGEVRTSGYAAGGLVGQIENTTVADASEIVASYSISDISVDGEVSYGHPCAAGGIAGFADVSIYPTSITACCYMGDMEADNRGKGLLGVDRTGVMGDIEFVDCYWQCSNPSVTESGTDDGNESEIAVEGDWTEAVDSMNAAISEAGFSYGYVMVSEGHPVLM